jgi:hypothetical protein
MMSNAPEHSFKVTKEGILSDLRVAGHLSEENNFAVKLPAVREWLGKEGLTQEDLMPQPKRR